MASKFKIQPFGLKRSGTNFIEKIILDHFDKNYNHSTRPQNVTGSRGFGGEESVKHTLPTFDYSDFTIVVYKPYTAWYNSMIAYGWRHAPSLKKEYWNLFHKKAIEIYNDKSIIVDWYTAASNYDSFVNHISTKFKMPLEKIHPMSTNKMGRGHGDLVSDTKFDLRPYAKSVVEELPAKLKELSWTL